MIGRVWIDPGCILCNACEETCPEVFEVTEKDCIIRPGADLTRVERIKHATEECPVGVIKFEETP